MVMVGVERKGCFHFNLMGGETKELHPEYVAEKLNLDGTDAEGIAGLLNAIRQLFAMKA